LRRLRRNKPIKKPQRRRKEEKKKKKEDGANSSIKSSKIATTYMI